MSKYTFFGFLAFGLFVAYKIVIREKNESGENGGFFFFGIVAIIFIIISALGLGALFMGSTGIFQILLGDRYDAIVVDMASFVAEDEDGYDRLMYSPIVQFTPNGQTSPIISKLNISSSGKYKMGQTHKVTYHAKTGKVSSAAISTIFILLGSLMIGLFLFSISLVIFCYAFYIPLPFEFADVIIVFMGYIFMPIGVIGLDLGLLYFLYQNLILGEQQAAPLWTIALSLFFSLLLTFLIVYSLKKVIKNKSLFVKS